MGKLFGGIRRLRYDEIERRISSEGFGWLVGWFESRVRIGGLRERRKWIGEGGNKEVFGLGGIGMWVCWVGEDDVILIIVLKWFICLFFYLLLMLNWIWGLVEMDGIWVGFYLNWSLINSLVFLIKIIN